MNGSIERWKDREINRSMDTSASPNLISYDIIIFAPTHANDSISPRPPFPTTPGGGRTRQARRLLQGCPGDADASGPGLGRALRAGGVSTGVQREVCAGARWLGGGWLGGLGRERFKKMMGKGGAPELFCYV